jgi:hypothetical protein
MSNVANRAIQANSLEEEKDGFLRSFKTLQSCNTKDQKFSVEEVNEIAADINLISKSATISCEFENESDVIQCISCKKEQTRTRVVKGYEADDEDSWPHCIGMYVNTH